MLARGVKEIRDEMIPDVYVLPDTGRDNRKDGIDISFFAEKKEGV